VLAADWTGYANLCQLLTRESRALQKGKEWPLGMSWRNSALDSHVLTGDEEGPVRRALHRGKDEAAAVPRSLIGIYGPDHVWVESELHRLRGEMLVGQTLRDLAGAHRSPVVASNGACSALPEGRMLLDAFSCGRHHTRLDLQGRLLGGQSERHLKGARCLKELFADVPEALSNTVKLADQLEFTSKTWAISSPSIRLGRGRPRLPSCGGKPMPGRNAVTGKSRPRCGGSSTTNSTSFNALGFPDTFSSSGRSPNLPGREDSGPGTGECGEQRGLLQSRDRDQVDPVGGNLLFERFLSEGRTSWPDIDIDLPSGERREAVIQESVPAGINRRGAAMTANVII